MKIDLVALNSKVFDTIEVRLPHELIVFNDRVWKKKSAKVWQEVNSTFVPLPEMGGQAALPPNTTAQPGSPFA